MQECLPHYCEAHPLSPRQWQVCHHLLACRTEALGERHLQCERCGHEVSFYHSCRDRHCPVCQQRASRDWCERQSAHTLEVPYHHLVFTLPQSINPWVELHPELIYDQLLKSTWETLRTFGADPKRLDGQLGATLVLHTWGQTLTRHLHVHCLVPGGALSAQGSWRAVHGDYLFPVRALSRYFRGHFVCGLRARYQRGELSRVRDPKTVDTLLDALMAQDWVVYGKACLAHTEAVVAYLARYTQRIALSESRLLDFRDGEVALDYRDYRDAGRHKVMHLSGEELIRRFLLHVLPKGFMRVRHCGFLANRCRAQKLTQIREVIGQAQAQAQEAAAEPAPAERYRCPRCRQGRLQVVAIRMPQRRLTRCPGQARAPDRRRH
jgi:hypothetical protein